MTIAISPQSVFDADRIPYVTADEAFTLMQTALERFLALDESLAPDDWGKSTACTEWNVRDILAHQAGGYASGISYKEMIRQYSSILKLGQLPEDAINAFQLKERAGKTPVDLIAELHRAGPIALQNWAHGFRLLKLVTIPHPIAGTLSIRHLMWVIHSRDTWMHRLDICRTTGRVFEQTKEHDGRINELVVLDLSQSLKKKLGGRAFTLVLTGIAGGTWKIGAGESTSTIEIDALDFNIYASGRFNYEEAHSRARFSGDKKLTELAFKNFLVLY